MESAQPNNVQRSAKTKLPVFDLEGELKAFENAEKKRLGLDQKRHWEDEMLSPLLSKRDRGTTTLLVGGLTMAHDVLIEGAVTGLGYKVQHLDVPDVLAFNTGKEFGNRGQCNPTYFTVGNLVKHLCRLRDQGMTTEEINKKYVFLTAGACGPCRFGMYVTEYRKALRDAGFGDFRVFLFQQQGGLKQATGDEIGIEFNPMFFITLLKSMLVGDVLNLITYRCRPYEVTPGETDRVLEESKKYLHDLFARDPNFFQVIPGLLHVRKLFSAIKLDKLKAKPKVAIIGEFWAMTTEGDGNYGLQRFLESEGAENEIQILLNTLLYNLWEASRDTLERKHLKELDQGKYGLAGNEGVADVAKKVAILRAADVALRSVFKGFALLTGLNQHKLPNMEAIAEVSHQYYSNDLRGGEGHLEVGKLILNSTYRKAHMTLSVKPFGCMPSSGVSDGVANMVADRFPESIFCAVETSGDGKVNFYSRVQMYLFKAKAKAEAELLAAYAEHQTNEAEVREFLAKNPRFNHPFHRSPHKAAGTAADLVHEVGPLLRLSKAGRLRYGIKQQVQGVVGKAKSLKATLVKAAERREELVALGKADLGFLYEAVTGRVQGLSPVLGELMQRAAGAKLDSAPYAVAAE